MNRSTFLLLAVAAVGATACSDSALPPTSPGSLSPSLSVTGDAEDQYVILGAGNVLPGDLAASVAAAGGTLVSSYGEIGVAVAIGGEGFAAAAEGIAGVESVVADIVIESPPPTRVHDLAGEGSGDITSEVASLADNEPFYIFQWAPAAIQAPEAWNAGFTGRGVRVAILDGGLFDLHPDLAANTDRAASRSFVPGFAYNQDVGTFWHGTHVAGIVAAADNSVGTIGIAPNATLIGVKVLHNGSGSLSWLISAIMYAATPRDEGGAGAHVINMSLGGVIPAHRGNIGKDLKKSIKELTKAIDRATSFAWDAGVTVIAAAGNDAINFKQNKDVIHIPSMSAKVISVAATGPFGWALGATDFSRPASYTNGGRKAVDLAAPGGDFALPGTASCTVAFITTACWVFDMYLSTSRAGWSWAAGTSMASPVVSGIAALIIEKNGGALEPAQVKSLLQRGAIDLGKRGHDDVYGRGWVNALSSVSR
ncbi:MAG: S8 family serine peptidase [Gemmatimonadaceae bacterium]